MTNVRFIDPEFNDDDETGDESASSQPTGTRPFSVKTRNSKQKYTFKNFTSARQGADLFTESEGSLQEKSDLFDKVAYDLEVMKDELERLRKDHGIIANGETSIALVPINFITVDPEWCRQKKVDWNHVAEIVVNFRPGSLSLPTITFRKIFTPAGKLQDVVISLTDGVHRTVSLRELGYTHVRALVQVVEEMCDEAQIYSDSNYNRRAHAKRDIFRARIAKGDEALMEIVKLVEKYGFKFSTHAGTKVAWPELGCIQTVEKLYYKYGPEVLSRVLELLSDPAFPEWHGKAETLRGDMLAGWCMYIDRFERPGFVHSNMTVHLLKNTTAGIVAEMAANGSKFGVSRPECDEIMNERVCPNSLNMTSEEGRAVKTCCAIMKKLKEFFKPSRRPADDFSPKFKEALELFYSRGEHRMAELMHLRRFFAKKKMADYWFAKTNSDIVR